MITEFEKQKLRNFVEDHFASNDKDYQNFDTDSYIDSTLTYEENLRIIKETLETIIPTNMTNQELKNMANEQEEMTKANHEDIDENKTPEESKNTLREIFSNQANVLIIGRKRSGKTCLGWAMAKEFMDIGNRELYVYRHPKPEYIKELPFKAQNLNSMKEIANLKNAVIIFDEAHLWFPTNEKAVNGQLRDILALSGQNNLCFIFICHSSYFVNRSLFSFIDIRVIKETNLGQWELERDFMKKLYENTHVYGIDRFFIDSDFHRGLEKFQKPEWFSDKLSFAYRNGVENDFFSKVREKPKSARSEKDTLGDAK